MRHIYIHVPFCRRRCSYCDFAIAVRRELPTERYIAAILAEIGQRHGTGFWSDEPVETLYLGGGTPSLLPAASLAGLTDGVVAGWSAQGSPTSAEPEFTIEVNPEDVSDEKINGWTDAHVNRVSVGVQSFHAPALEWMHRTHRAHDPELAVARLRRAGVKSLSLDLMFGLPAELGADWESDLQSAMELEPDHLSVYGLTVEPRTPLARWIGRGVTSAPADLAFEEQFLLAHDILTDAGFEHYEVSNYAKPGHRSRHNWAYWTGRPYLGLGPSAHGYDGGRRYWNVAPWAAYERAVSADRDPTENVEMLSPEQKRLEATYLGLRTAEGVPAEVTESWPEALREEVEANGWMIRMGDRVRMTPLGWLRLDSIAAGT